MSKRVRGVAGLLVLVGGLIGGVPGRAHAAPVERVIKAGFTNDRPYQYTAFYPATLQVHRGDTVRFDVEVFHNVAFLPNDDERLHPSFLRSDETAATTAINEPWAFASPGCGLEGAAPCERSDLSTFQSSGVAFGPRTFRVTMDLAPGTYRYHCLIHPPMHGFVNVVSDATAVPTAAAVQAQVAQQQAADTAAADALVAAKSTPTFTIESGVKVWKVSVGAATADRRVNISEYLPGALNVARNDVVRFESQSDENHTVTFPEVVQGDRPTINGIAAPVGLGGMAQSAACDPDDPAQGLPGAIGPYAPFGRLPCAGTVELLVNRWMTDQQRAPGDAVATPATLHNSGIIVSASAPDWARLRPGGSGQYLPSGFEAAFPASGSFAYGCNVHIPFMQATVTVA